MPFTGSVLSCFKDMQFLIFQLLAAGRGLSAADPDAGLLIDDVKYTYTTCPKN